REISLRVKVSLPRRTPCERDSSVWTWLVDVTSAIAMRIADVPMSMTATGLFATGGVTAGGAVRGVSVVSAAAILKPSVPGVESHRSDSSAGRRKGSGAGD